MYGALKFKEIILRDLGVKAVAADGQALRGPYNNMN